MATNETTYKDWKEKLQEWLQANNSKTIPTELLKLREEFVRRFPKERLGEMTLEEYAVGTGGDDNFSYWLEYKTKELGRVGSGGAIKTGVWWSKADGGWSWNKKTYKSPDGALSRITTGLVKLVEAAEEARFDELDDIGEEYLGSVRYIRAKPLSLYFPDEFLPMWQQDHMANFLKVFGEEPRGEVLERNRQLLQLLRGLPEFEGFDTFGMMSFLYTAFPQAGETQDKTVAAWKIAPGEGARHWDVCRERGCILIGWLRDVDYREFPDKAAIRKALTDAGQRSGGASQIWNFTSEMKPGDIVVANKGVDTVVGVGRVMSAYLPSSEAQDLTEGTDYTHARRVDWLIEEPLTLPPNFFGHNTVKALDAPRWEQIKQAYLEQNPKLEDVFAELEGDSEPTSYTPTPRPATVPAELKELMEITARTRNVLLYGPPGTGKTWLVNHFTNYFLLRHNVSAEAADDYWRAKGTAEARALSASVCAEAEASRGPAFWWMVANEGVTEWSWKILFEKGEWFFGKRNLARNFAEAKPGDLVFGYLARPHKQVVALARIESPLETRLEGGEEKEGILLKPIEQLSRPLDWRTVVSNPQLKNSEPVRLNSRGSMFRLSVEEANELARMLNEEGNNVALPTGARGNFAEFVTFHQSFAYEEFVEGLKPVAPEDGEIDEVTGEPVRDITYKVLPGVFRRICARARTSWDANRENPPKYLLVVDEINRANIAKVLGELITLVEDDKRLGEANEVTVTLPYSGERFGVPPNLYILGTMNTADRSIALLDLALRRRFTFVEMTPDASAISPAVVAGVDLRALLSRLNERVAALLDRDHRIGHSYFLGIRDAEALRFVWHKRVVPLLQEYFYNDHERLRTALGDKFVRRADVSDATRSALGELYDAEQPPHEIAQLEGEAFLDALRELAGAGGASAQAEE
jgi:5-methylcytosine-specific restriction protein B